MTEKHELFTITATFTVCEGLKDKVLDEVTNLRKVIEKSLDHASNVKTSVTHVSTEDQKEIH
jgi:hypothetical protein